MKLCIVLTFRSAVSMKARTPADETPCSSGELRGTLALTEDSGRWDEAAVTLTATHSADGWVLEGNKSFDLKVWSRYEEGGPPADLNYHVLNRDLAGALCRRTGEEEICKASDSFARELERRCPKATTPRERSAPPSRIASRTS